MYQYDDVFYDYIRKGAIEAAGTMLPLVKRCLPIASVADFGCGQGAWLSVWKQLGVKVVRGVDGDYVRRDGLLIDPTEFEPRDLTRPTDLGKRFDLVQSLEVAEHLPTSAAATFIATLVAHGDLVLFSAAVPGQGGENHINEQPYEFWRDRFREHGYVPIDWLRPKIRTLHNIAPWYRYNILLYANEEKLQSLSAEVARARIPDDTPVPDMSPLIYRIRKALLRPLAPRVYTRLALLKKRLIVARQGRARSSQ